MKVYIEARDLEYILTEFLTVQERKKYLTKYKKIFELQKKIDLWRIDMSQYINEKIEVKGYAKSIILLFCEEYGLSQSFIFERIRESHHKIRNNAFSEASYKKLYPLWVEFKEKYFIG